MHNISGLNRVMHYENFDCSTVESRGATAADTIFSEGFNRANFTNFVASETREVLARFKTCLPVLTSLGLGTFEPETTGTEARSDSSSGVRGAPRGSGVHSSTSSSIYCWMVRVIKGSEFQHTNLFRKMNEVFLSIVRAGAGLKKGANGKKCQ